MHTMSKRRTTPNKNFIDEECKLVASLSKLKCSLSYPGKVFSTEQVHARLSNLLSFYNEELENFCRPGPLKEWLEYEANEMEIHLDTTRRGMRGDSFEVGNYRPGVPGGEAAIKELFSQLLLCIMQKKVRSEMEDVLPKLFVVLIPPYWMTSVSSVWPAPRLSNHYKIDSDIHKRAQNMIDTAFSQSCLSGEDLFRCRHLASSSCVNVLKSERIENHEALERFAQEENRIYSRIAKKGERFSQPDLPYWLRYLSKKHDLKTSANSWYLLHGTTAKNLSSIVENGLMAEYSLRQERHQGTYGSGLYFTNNPCKASQYGNVILICRVVLGVQEILRGPVSEYKLFPAYGCDSAMAKRNFTFLHHLGIVQLHDEFIVYNDAQCYPEFAIHWEYRCV